jgi:hypothetical protein
MSFTILLLVIITSIIISSIFSRYITLKYILNFIFHFDHLDINYQLLILISLMIISNSFLIFISSIYKFDTITIKNINKNKLIFLILFIIFIIIITSIMSDFGEIINLYFK